MLTAKNLSFGYRSVTGAVTPVLKNINFSVGDGEFVGLIGSTGSGKSTLVSLLAGILRPDDGEISLDDRRLWAKGVSMRELRFDIGLCFQYPEYQLFDETVFSDISFGPKNMGLSESEIKERVHFAAEAVGLSQEILARNPFELSGGQKRRAAIAGVLAMRPKFLLLDEPAAGLDPDGKERLLELLHQYHADTGAAVLLVSHSMDDIAEYAEKVMVLAEGEIILYDTMPNVFKHAKKLAEQRLSIPQITQLFLALHEKNENIPTDVYTVEYAAKQFIKNTI